MALSYLVKFNALPKEIKAKINAPEVVARVSELEKEYGVDLAAVIMKIMTREVKLDSLGAYFINEFSLPADKAGGLERSLRRSVFGEVIDYLLEPADKGPKHVLAESDEAEVKRSAKPVSTTDFDTMIEKAVEEVARRSRVNLADPLTGGKFRQVIKTYLRGSRDKRAVSEALTKAAELGGLALSPDTAERVLMVAGGFMPELVKAQASASPKIAVAEDQLPPAPSVPTPAKPLPPTRDVDYNLEAALKTEGKLKKPAPVARQPKRIMDPAHELMPPTPAVIEKQPAVPAPTSRSQVLKDILSGKPLDREGLRRLADKPLPPAAEVSKGKKLPSPPAPGPTPTPTPPAPEPRPEPVVNRPATPTGKIKMDDIRFTPRVVSPVDELRYLTLRNFRRLGSDPARATEKIREKIELIGREDYGKKIEAIVAWNQSPLNRLYLEVGRRSLEENLPVKDILARELKSEPEFLKPAELEAIISLNKILKF